MSCQEVCETETHSFPIEQLHEFCYRVLQRFDVPRSDARRAADLLIAADLRGVDAHGVVRLRAYYDMLAEGLVNPRPRIRVVRQSQSTARVDGDNGLGLVVGPRANDIAMEKAVATGSGWVAVANSNHFGMAAYYPLKALERDLIGWAMTNTPPVVAPLWGAEAMLGTNPLAIAFPGKRQPPIVIDFATSATTEDKVERALRNHQLLPEGVAIDRHGRVATRPAQALEGGALLPLGGDRRHGGHKGVCLAAMVDILCGPLSGANWGPFVPPFAVLPPPHARRVGKGLGHFFGAMRIDGFIDPDDFKRQIDEWVEVLRSTKALPGTLGTRIPGDPERETELTRRLKGIPLSPDVVEELRSISNRTRIPFD